jgi:hypothetical protein
MTQVQFYKDTRQPCLHPITGQMESHLAPLLGLSKGRVRMAL